MIQKYANELTVKGLCEYFKVSRSGYYSWIKASPNRWQRILKSYGVCMNHKTVLRLMNKYGLLAEIRRPRPLYMRQQQMRRYENVLNRNFFASYPNQKWATDISYIFTDEGTLYLSMIKDLHDSFIVAFDMAATQDNALVYRTLKKAKKEVADGLILHSDQGCQYTS